MKLSPGKISRFQIELLISIIVFILGIYIPIKAYYHTSGPFAFLEWGFLMILCLIGTFNTVTNYLLKKLANKYRYVPMLFCLLGTSIALSIFYLDSITFEELDWKTNREKRKRIVLDILTNKIKSDSLDLIQLDTWIPLSNGGNEISVRKCKSGITVKFWIDRGFLDTHSEFVYSNCPEDISAINELIKRYNDKKIYKQIEPNWYRLNNYD